MNALFRFLAAAVLALAALPSQAACPRIVSQSPYVTYALEWMGLSDCIVGVSRYDSRDLPRTGGVIDPDADMIALVDAQLIITADWADAETWRKATPRGARVLRVGGFDSMAGVEAMLREIGRAAGVADVDARVDRFAAEWRAAAARVNGGGRRVLLVSACTDVPYSFGPGTALYDLFTRAGFEVVETQQKIHQFPADPPAGDLSHWLDRVKPEIAFAFSNHWDGTCNAALARPGLRVVPLDGELFYHPGPRLVEGLARLREVMAE
ncbi:MAG: ABC transporter substrate-binding protein [Ignavibacteria bacterium]